MEKTLKKEFFNWSAEVAARDLLGKNLCIKTRKGVERYKITETEAYAGEEDEANHAHKGRTERTEVMFGDPGCFYVYFVYGMYHMLNVVTEEKEKPSAVLIRGLEGMPGPGILTRNLKIDKSFNGKPASKKTGLWFEDRKMTDHKTKIERHPRVGIDYAPKKWRKAPLRFKLVDPLFSHSEEGSG